MSLRFVCLSWLVAVCTFWPSASARAFCRTTTLDAGVPLDDCHACAMNGPGVAWPRPDIEVVLQADEIPDQPSGMLRAQVGASFEQWQSVQCDAGAIEIEVQAATHTTEVGPRDSGVEPATNVIGYLTKAEWAENDFDRRAFAQTKVRFFKGSGVIVGADMWLNGGIGSFAVCPSAGCPAGGSTVDLPNVLTHEIGHFFGLAHSQEPGATMACEALPEDTDKRSLEADDRAGICAIYPPGIAFRGRYQDGAWQPPAKRPGTCSVSVPSADGPVRWQSGLALALALLFARRRAATSLRR